MFDTLSQAVFMFAKRLQGNPSQTTSVRDSSTNPLIEKQIFSLATQQGSSWQAVIMSDGSKSLFKAIAVVIVLTCSSVSRCGSSWALCEGVEWVDTRRTHCSGAVQQNLIKRFWKRTKRRYLPSSCVHELSKERRNNLGHFSTQKYLKGEKKGVNV